MRGRRIGIVLATIAMFGVLLSPAGVQAAVGAHVAADDSSLRWDQSTTIRWNTTISSGGPLYFNGTIFINLTAPSATVHQYTSTVVLSDTILNDWYNFTINPSEAGTWTITAEAGSGDGLNTTAIPDASNTFSVESQGTAMGRMIQDLAGTMVLVFIVVLLFVVMILVFNRVSKDDGKAR